jgi:hypothetical protein
MPFGLWSPLKKALPPDEAAAMFQEHKHDLISLTFALFWQISMLMRPLLLIVRPNGATAVTARVLGVSPVGLTFCRYRKLPS